jgi:hypothetical protein
MHESLLVYVFIDGAFIIVLVYGFIDVAFIIVLYICRRGGVEGGLDKLA